MLVEQSMSNSKCRRRWLITAAECAAMIAICIWLAPSAPQANVPGIGRWLAYLALSAIGVDYAFQLVNFVVELGVKFVCNKTDAGSTGWLHDHLHRVVLWLVAAAAASLIACSAIRTFLMSR